jgi:3-hydroxybutyryl-CoA dehydrogenase
MTTQRGRQRPGSFRALPSGPSAFLLGDDQEVAALEPVLRRAGMAVVVHRVDPPTLDVENIVLDEDLAERIQAVSLAVLAADVCGDDRLPLLSFIDESLPPRRLLLASCTQAGVNEQAAICQHGERLVGLGVLGLLSGKPVVEIAGGYLTEATLLEQAEALFASASVSCRRVSDSPGLVLARILMPIMNEAATAVADGLADAETIDLAMRIGAGFPIGPLVWADLLGLDRVLLAMEYLVQATHEERYRPEPILRRMAQAGRTGRAAGQGFYRYGAVGADAASSSRSRAANSGTPTTP